MSGSGYRAVDIRELDGERLLESGSRKSGIT